MSQNTVGIQVKSTDQSGQGFESARKHGESFKATLKDIGTTAAGVLTADLVQRAAGAFKSFVASSVTAASDLNESLNAVNVTFGASAAEITAWGKDNAASFGLSQRAFNEMATPLAAMLKNAGMSMQDTTKWTVDLTKRAADMASVFNTTVPEALEAIQAGLRGESDPLERFGVGLSAAKVEAAALAETGKRSASALTDQEKATARLNLIMQQTSSTQGDFANTSDGAANATRIATAQFENAQASLGQALLPMLAKAATAAATLAEGFAALPGPLQSTIVVGAALGLTAALLVPKILELKAALSDLRGSSLATGTGMQTLGADLEKIGLAFTSLQIANMAFGKSFSQPVNTATKELEEWVKTGESASDLTGKMGHDLGTLQGGFIGLGSAQKNVAEALDSLGFKFLQGSSSITATKERIASLDAALAGLASGGKADQAAAAFSKITDAAKKEGVSIDELKAAFPQYAEALAQAETANKKTAGAADKLTASVTDQREALDKAADAILGQRDAMRGLEASYDDASEALKKNGRTLDIGTEKGRANQAALDDIAGSAHKAAQAVLDAGGSQEQANKIMLTARGRFEAAGRAMGLTAGQARALADRLLAIPKNVTVRVSAVDAASRVVSNVAQRLAWLNGRQAWVSVNATNRNFVEGRASGGVVGGLSTAASGGARGNSVLVGEGGPEVVELAPGSRVRSNPDTRRMLDGGVGAPTTVILEINSSGSRTDDLLLEILRSAVRVRGGDVQVVIGNGRAA